MKKINSKGENKYGHTAPYPEELVQYVINRTIPYLKENIRIIDPFLGSGTTSIVANRMEYNSTGIELNENYFTLSCERLENNFENLSFNF
ncbi:DNA methyltransferase [Jeotgalicoccus meleagridis]|uniref:DNA methyltransferase n=1 Tax=Jeotgalicoccus meleagridis TaxID=2759181 RepID=UPI00161FCC1F|nr:DNA methyltransferase [Jeotgalicoccus meleagridis]